MKSILLVLLFSLSILPVTINAQQYWLQRGGGATIDEGIDISTDAVGNTYATGYFTSTASFTPYSLTSTGVEDIYLCKMNATGVYQWAVKAGGSASDRPMSLKTDANGNSFITGYFYGTATFGSFNITSSGLQDIFIAKYDNTGTCVWVRSAGGTQSDIGNGITLDGAGNVLVTGQFTGTATFGGFNLTSMNGSTDVFTTKLDGNGNFLWAKKGSGPLTDKGIDIACDASGSVFVTGMFSDTITFDFVHNNNMANAIFVVKYDASGNEQWFCRAGGGIINVVSGIAIDQNGNAFITGDFQGTLSIFSTSGLTTLTNAYPNRIFALKFSPTGALIWSTAHGSHGAVSAKNIAIDGAGNPYIVGNFQCRMNQYADQYGQGTFNSVGFWDIFVTKLNSSGSWQWSRQAGGHNNESGNGIALNAGGEVFITGSFSQDLIFPTVNSMFLGYNTNSLSGCITTYCNDNHYSEYQSISTSGNSDIFIAKAIDLNRQPYDFYKRTGNGCDRPANSVCINDGSSIPCLDTVKFCSNGTIYANTQTCNGIGPLYTYTWSNGATTPYDHISSTGNYSVTLTSVDECSISSDTIYVKINPPPPIPTITDNHGVNINAITTHPIVFCAPGTALLTGGNYGNNTISWTGPNGTSPTNTFLATVSGSYVFKVIDSNGCVSSNYVQVEIDSGFAHSGPKMICPSDSDHNDTVSFCTGHTFTMFIFDTISNPLGHDTCPPYSTIYWSVTPNTISFVPITNCPTNTFTPNATGWYNVSATWIRINICDTDTVICSKSIYVNLYPLPTLPSYTMNIVGPNLLCPSGGDTLLLVASGTPSYYWTTGSNNDSIYVTSTGSYTCSYSAFATNIYGCTASSYTSASISVSIKPQPNITMNPLDGVICPGDSVQLTCSGAGSFLWQGPNGPVGGNNNPIYIFQTGSYYCTLTDSDGCVLVSNTAVISQYTTPYLISSNSIFCQGDTVSITVMTNPNSTITWLAPLSGNNPIQYITQEGTYTCNITSCGITTPASIIITQSHPIATITSTTPLTFCIGDSVILSANQGMLGYLWTPGLDSTTSITTFQSGNYILTTTDTNGCKAKDTVSVLVTPAYSPPHLSISPDTIFCPGDTVTITVVSDPHSILQWQYPLSGNNFTQQITATGTYACNVSYCNITATDSIHVRVSIPVAKIIPLGALTFCGGDSVILNSNIGMAYYCWLPDSILQSGITVFNSGTYLLNTKDTIGCIARDTVIVNVLPNEPPVRPDTIICNGASITINAAGAQAIEWYNSPDTTLPYFFRGSSFTTPVLTDPVTYYLISNTGQCKSKMISFNIEIEDCYIFIPNIFTPNGDGKNDLWTIDARGFKDLKVKIYNRWGMLVYEWTGTLGGWNGEVLNTGRLAPDGVYFWIAEMNDLFNVYSRRCGTLELIKNR